MIHLQWETTLSPNFGICDTTPFNANTDYCILVILDFLNIYHNSLCNLFFFYSNRWTQAFRTHVGEMHHRLKSGDLQVKISNATSRALTGDTSLSVNSFFKSNLDIL
jgi:hypothetical protein